MTPPPTDGTYAWRGVDSPVRAPGGCRTRASRCLQLIAASVVALPFLVGIGKDGVAAFGHSTHRPILRSNGFKASSITGLIPRHAVPAPPAPVADLPPMSDASVYVTEVDPITAQLDVSALPSEMGVYAVFDLTGNLQYIGLSRDMRKSVAGHADAIGLQEVGGLIAQVRCLEMPGQGKDVLKKTWERWIKEHIEEGGEIPVGNLPEGAPGADSRWRSRSATSKPPLNLAGVRGITSPHEAMAAVEEVVQNYPVLLFMKGSPAMPQCGFSARTVGIMSQIGVPYETVNVLDDDANPGVRDAVKKYSNWPTIPQLFVRGELVGGCDIITELHESGQLAQQLKNAASGDEAAPSSAASVRGAAGDAVGTVTLVNDPSRPTASLMSRVLNEQLQLNALSIVDESSQHAGDAGALEMGLTSESHFKVEIVASDFEGLSPVLRQKKVFDALSDVMPRIHALSLVTRTPAEVS
mmetsp:Transcript_18376/g.50425  ORF Transcript_18376/g.50425 Transcript_18376/m.50425 type:complete len:467 (-) Transcript_18376:32-1432(-)